MRPAVERHYSRSCDRERRASSILIAIGTTVDGVIVANTIAPPRIDQLAILLDGIFVARQDHRVLAILARYGLLRDSTDVVSAVNGREQCRWFSIIPRLVVAMVVQGLPPRSLIAGLPCSHDAGMLLFVAM